RLPRARDDARGRRDRPAAGPLPAGPLRPRGHDRGRRGGARRAARGPRAPRRRVARVRVDGPAHQRLHPGAPHRVRDPAARRRRRVPRYGTVGGTGAARRAPQLRRGRDTRPGPRACARPRHRRWHSGEPRARAARWLSGGGRRGRVALARRVPRADAGGRRGWGRVAPNPLVGAVVRRGDAVVGEGWHAEFGGPHAEVAALASAGRRARGGSLVVPLEPCAHHGKTPPCTDAILAAGVARVVAALRDPDPEAQGGAASLRGRGVDVAMGLLAEEAAALNAPFLFSRLQSDRPFVALKLAT